MTQPEALRLANYFDYHGFFDSDRQAATELRRLHEVNNMLVDAIEEIRQAENSEGGATGGFVPKAPTKEHWLRVHKAWQKANEALAKAKE